MITYRIYPNKPHELVVLLDGKRVGTIKRLGAAQYQYFPKGKRVGGDVFSTLADCQRSLAG